MILIRQEFGYTTSVEINPVKTVRQAATEAAIKMGMSPYGLYTLAHRGLVFDYEAQAPNVGVFDLVDAGDAV